MRQKFFTIVSLGLSLLVSACSEYQDKDSYYPLKNQGPTFELKILTFNILSSVDLLSVGKGYPVWGQRRAAMMSFIEDLGADVVGLQESAITQADHFRSALSDRYEMIENVAYTPDTLLLVKKGHVQIIEKGYWLLEDVAQLKSIRRLALWAKLRHEASGREFLAVTAHIDATDKNKQREVRYLINKLRKEQASDAPLFFFGDFNFIASDQEFSMLIDAGWQDSFLGTVEIPTFPVRDLQRRIDHVLFHGKNIIPSNWEAKDYAPDEVLLSDHRPVIVDFLIQEAP